MANSIKENQYWLRLVVCASEHINPGLLGVLHNDGPNPDLTYIGIPRDPKLLYTFLSTPQSLLIINRLKKIGLLKQDQFELLFPPGCIETDSKKFDPTLNQVMIRNFTTLKTANGSWKIDEILPGDTSVAANTVRAVALRNCVYHYGNPAAMEKPEFDNKFTQADNILKGMRYTGNISNVKTMSLDPERISVLKALYNLIQNQISKLQIAYDKKIAADIASTKVLTTDVSKLKDDMTAYENLSKEKTDSAKKMVDELLDHVQKIMLSIDSIKDEITNKIEELKDYVMTETSKQICTVETKVNKMEGDIEEITDEVTNKIEELKDYVDIGKEETSKQICTVGTKVNKMEREFEEIADEMTNKTEELKDYVDIGKEETSKQICTVGTKVNKMEGEFEDRLKNVEKQQHILRASK